VRQQAPFPRIDGLPPAAPSGAPRLGEHNDEVYRGLLGLSEPELQQLRDTEII
jgi:crotonobetainyl-CoA:carnitine CoA-transferase CaiB-like acyl-CoA transferase